MIEKAQGRRAVDRLRGRRPARVGRARPSRSTCSVSNATLQWVPGPPRPAARHWSSRVRPGGWLAFQVPGNFDEPSHTIRTRARRRGAVRRPHPRRRGPEQPRPGRLPRGAGRPRLHASTPGRRRTSTCSPAPTRSSPGSPAPARGRPSRRCPTTCGRRSRTEFRRRLRAAYPEHDGRVVLPFRRIFVVARVAAGSTDASHDRPPPRPGRLPARRRGRRPPLLRRRVSG